MTTFEATYTDTLGGEPNFRWVRRTDFAMKDNASQRSIMRRAKKELGLTGARGRTFVIGGEIWFKPYGFNRVLMIEPQY